MTSQMGKDRFNRFSAGRSGFVEELVGFVALELVAHRKKLQQICYFFMIIIMCHNLYQFKRNYYYYKLDPCYMGHVRSIQV